MLKGIRSLLSSAIHSLTSGVSMIIKAIGTVLRDTFHRVGDLDEKVVGSIASATSSVIGAGASGVSKILDFIGGQAGIVLYILVIALYAYIIYSRWGKKSPFTLRFRSDEPAGTGKEYIPEKTGLVLVCRAAGKGHLISIWPSPSSYKFNN